MEWIKQKLEEAHKQRERLQESQASSTEGVTDRKLSESGSQNYRLFALKNKATWLLSGITLVIASAMITWLVASNQEPAEWLYNLDLFKPHQTNATGSPTAEQLETRVTGLIERVAMLTDSIARLESRLTHVQGITDSIIGAQQKIASPTTQQVPAMGEAVRALETLPRPTAGQTDVEAGVAKTPRQTSAAGTNKPRDTTVIANLGSTSPAPLRKPDKAIHEAPASTTLATDTVAREQSSTSSPLNTALSPEKGGPWVINLASSPSKADADRLTEKARTRDIQTEQQQVTVKGTQYWRVQITGFSTAEEARAHAGDAKEKLGLKSVWITTR